MRLKASPALKGLSFTVQLDYAVSDIYTYKKLHTAWLGTARWTDLSTRHYIKPSPKGVVTCADMSPSRLTNDAVCIYSK